MIIIKSKFLNFIFLMLICIVQFSCSKYVLAPERIQRTPTHLDIKNSNINLIVTIDQGEFNQYLKEDLKSKNPIIPDNNPIHISAKIVTAETKEIEDLVKEEVSKAVDGHYITVLKETFQTVREAFSCALSFWKWGTCWKNVTKKVWVQTQVWIAPQAAIFTWVLKKVIIISDKVFNIETTIHYPTEIVNTNIVFAGDQFTVEAYFNTMLKFDYKQNLIPLGPSLKLNSVLKIDLGSKCIIKGKLEITKEGDLNIIINEGDTRLTIDNVDPRLPIIDKSVPLNQYLEPFYLKIINPILIKFTKNALNKAIKKAIDKNSEKLNFKNKLEDFASIVSEPKKLSSNLWLNINPKLLKISQVNGIGGKLNISLGFEFIPTIEFTEKTPSIKPSDISIDIATLPLPETSNINVRLFSNLTYVQQLISNKLNEIIDLSSNTFVKKLHVKEVSIYNTKDDKIAIKVSVFKKNIFSKYCKLADFYLIGNLRFDNVNGLFTFQNLNFTAESTSALLNGIYKKYFEDILNDAVRKKLQDKLYYSIADELKKIDDKLKNEIIETNNGTFKLNFSQDSINSPILTDSTLEVYSFLKGQISYSFEPFRGLYSNTASSTQLFINDNFKVQSHDLKADSRKYEIDKLNTIITTEIVGNIKKPFLSTNNQNQNFIAYDKILDTALIINQKGLLILNDPNTIALNNNLINKENLFFLTLNENDKKLLELQKIKEWGGLPIKTGLPIYYEQKGKGYIRMSKYEDIPSQNEEILYSPKPGSIVKFKYEVIK